MKNIFSVLLVSIFLFGCSKDDDTSGSIIGTWERTYNEYTIHSGYIDPITGEDVVTYSYSEAISNDTTPENAYLVFRDDGTCSDYYYYDGDLTHAQDWDYIRDGDMLTVTLSEGNSEDDPIGLEITKLTSTDFHYSGTNRYEWDGWYGDTTFFDLSNGSTHYIKSELPSFTATPVNKNKPINGYNSFLHRRTK